MEPKHPVIDKWTNNAWHVHIYILFSLEKEGKVDTCNNTVKSLKIPRQVKGFPGGTSGKEPIYQCREHKRHRFNPWVRKIPWRRARNPLQYSCLENPRDKGAWWATVHGVEKSQTRLKRPSTRTYHGPAKWKRPVMKGQTLRDFSFMRFLTKFIEIESRMGVAGGFPGGRGQWGVKCLTVYKVSSGEDEDVLQMHGSDGYTTLYLMPQSYILQMVNLLQMFYHHKNHFRTITLRIISDR